MPLELPPVNVEARQKIHNLIYVDTEDLAELQVKQSKIADEMSRLQAASADVDQKIHMYTNRVDLDDLLEEMEQTSLQTKDLGLFVLARAMRFPYYENPGEKLDAERHGQRNMQNDEYRTALDMSNGYRFLQDTLLRSDKPQPFIRFDGFYKGRYERLGYGTLLAGWLPARAEIDLIEHRLEESDVSANGVATVRTYTETDIVVNTVTQGTFAKEYGWDDVVLGITYRPTANQESVSLMDGTPLQKIPDQASPRHIRRILNLDASRACGFIIGQKACLEFVGTLSAWEQGREIQNPLTEIITHRNPDTINTSYA